MRSADEKPVGLTWPKPRRYWRSARRIPSVAEVDDGPLRMRAPTLPARPNQPRQGAGRARHGFNNNNNNIRPHTEQYHTVRCTLTKRHGSPKSAQCMAKGDRIKNNRIWRCGRGRRWWVGGGPTKEKLARAASFSHFLRRHGRARMANTFHGIFSEYIRPHCSMLQQR